MIIRVLIYFGIFYLSFNLVRDINDALTQASLLQLIFGTLILIGLYYIIKTRKVIEYDDIKHILYVLDLKGEFETEIPVEKIDKILYSRVGLNSNHSYVIIYRDFHNQEKKVRLFPIAFRNDIDTIITDTRLKNPDVVTRNWSMGGMNFLIEHCLLSATLRHGACPHETFYKPSYGS